MRKIVISGINLFEGGGLTVYKEFLQNMQEICKDKDIEIVTFVHNKKDFSEFESCVLVNEIPKSRKSYLFRLWYEYVYFYFYSRKKNIDVWISMHDITPNVKAKKRYVYCHNPSPFMKAEIKNIKYSYRNFLFSIFYKYLYKINIKKNTSVIVQQNWMRKEFEKMYNINNVIVARPSAKVIQKEASKIQSKKNKKTVFIYPAYPRFFKNFEIICRACELLEQKGIKGFEVLLTIDGSENRYSREIVKNFSNLNNVKFIGLQQKDEMHRLYKEVDSMIFPSKLETWGLPISEFKVYNKPMLVVDLPYARESVDDYDKVIYFDKNDVEKLAIIMEKEITRKNTYEKSKKVIVESPVANSWKELINILLE